jgi:hypothetical protein
VATPDVNQRGEDGLPLPNRCTETRLKKDMSGPLRTIGIALAPPSRGGPTCKVYVMPRASSR